MTPKIIISEVGTPLYLFESIPQINDVKIADLKAHNASFRSAIFTKFASFLLNIKQFGLSSIKKVLKVLKLPLYKCLVDTLYTLILDVGLFVRK